jgi:phosphopantothenoylcysteine decarboxylase/phosphopantothenate--cysteine ligase
MTRNAARFITPLTFEALAGNRVVCDMWDRGTDPMDHITLGQESDLIIVAPATASILSKMSVGAADDFLSTMLLASTAPILLCPSMNTRMYLHPAVQQNIRLLKERGCSILDPDEGELACKAVGPGRLPDPENIVLHARLMLGDKDLSGLKILVTAGATREPIDPVRYITNRSSGKMGYALARTARRRGADVVLVSGPGSEKPPQGVSLVRVSTAEEMRQAVLSCYDSCRVVIKAAAVSDYRPREAAARKIKKGVGPKLLELVENPDILGELGRLKKGSDCILVGFAAETNDLLANAEDKLRKKNLDMIVANDVSRTDAGFETDTNQVKLLYRDGRIEDLPLMTKDELADRILDRVKALL